MAQSYCSCMVHYVFSTKGRQKQISREVRDRLWPYIGGIARENAMKAFAVGGTDDHAHVLISLPSIMSVAKGVQLIKGGSSKWIHETFATHRDFDWQDGYGAFSIGVSRLEETIHYINHQEEHHRTRTFEEEYLEFLRRHDMPWNERYVFG